MTAIVEVSGLTKTYKGGFQALKGVDLAIEEGEILALLGPNGAGKTTLISALCGIVQPTGGTARVGGFDVVEDYRGAARHRPPPSARRETEPAAHGRAPWQ